MSDAPLADASSFSPCRGVAFWIGWVLSVLLAALMSLGGIMDVTRNSQAIEGMQRMGYPESAVVPLGWVTLLSAVLYLIPRTAMFGMAMVTAYFGGAVASHLRMSEFNMMPGGVIVCVVMWVALVLRDRRVRAAVFG